MSYQTSQAAYTTPEHDPSQAPSAAHEILFGRANVLKGAISVKEIAVHVAMQEQRAEEARRKQAEVTAKAIPQHRKVSEALATLANQTPNPLQLDPEEQKSREIRRRLEEVQDAHDNSDTGGIDASKFMGYEDISDERKAA